MRGCMIATSLVLAWAVAGCADDADDSTGDADGSGSGDVTTATSSTGTDDTGASMSSTATTTAGTATSTTGTSGATTGIATTGADDGCPVGNEWFEPGCQPPPAGPPFARFSGGCYVSCQDDSDCGPNESCEPIWYENACPCPPWEQFCCEACGGAETTICLPV